MRALCSSGVSGVAMQSSTTSLGSTSHVKMGVYSFCMVCPYDLMTVMGHAVSMAGLVSAATALALVSMMVTVL